MRVGSISFIVGILVGIGVMLGLFASLQAAVAEEPAHDGYIIGFQKEQVDGVATRIAPRAGKGSDVRALALRSVAREIGVKPTAVLSGVDAIVVTENLTSLATKMLRSKATSKIKYIEPNYQVDVVAVPNDASYGSLWGMGNIKAPEAWDVKSNSSDVVVAVLDTGIDFNHPDLAANMWVNGADTIGDGIDNDGNLFADDQHGGDFLNHDSNPMDDNSHGTHCAGTIGAVGNNGIGVAGVNWNVKLMALKFLGANGSGYTSGAVEGVLYAVDQKIRNNVNVRVISASFGGGGYSQALADAITAAGQNGIVFVAAAGNSGLNVDTSPSYPASYTNPNIISVAAIASNDLRASFSNYGATGVDLGAPGVGILSTVLNGGYASYSGTSMATPHVAGAAALLSSQNPDLTPVQVKDALMESSRIIGALNGITVSGGTLDLQAALLSVTDTPAPVTHSISGTITVTGTALAGVTVSFGALGSATTNAQGQYTLSGVTQGVNYTATPSKAGYTFSPTSASGTLSADASHNFTATAPAKVSVAGTVVDSVTGTPLAGVAIILFNGDTPISAGLTGRTGKYGFKNLNAGVTYTLQLSNASYTIAQSPYSLTLSASQTGLTFYGTRRLVQLSGVVIDRFGRPFAGLSVASAPLGVTTTTNASGAFTFSNVPSGTRQLLRGYSSTGRRVFSGYVTPINNTSVIIRGR